VEAINAVAALTPEVGTGSASSMADLGSEDFLRLLITELTNQDPLEPMENQDLLNQISSIRDIEASTTLTESLRMLTGQQRFSSASSLIGRYVTSVPDADGAVMRGSVVGIRFDADGQPMLQLEGGVEISIGQVATIESPERAAEALIGLVVVGVDQRDPADPKVVEGQVTSVKTGAGGEVMLELDSGDDLRFRDFVSVKSDGT
jgi:flagellar basal-body rod modification protein FlgD